MGTDGTPGAKGPTVSDCIYAKSSSNKHSALDIGHRFVTRFLLIMSLLHSDRALWAPLVLRAWQGPLDLKDLRVALDLQEFEANR